ncbi:Aste57867_18741 [Aphanomyces stellatus]|uniref:Aste57867_18741 protein n=1 Tax=Aphanomyces stellatus TaxID=120398 RepID=A0A485LBR5_9STRA|nr:hypothetical protein As57867_018677 [Aphanomyces stellatus]VFT95475.1 Aste57867_18741 [Aphanomyces stellatus]
MMPVPISWTEIGFETRGGSPLCPEIPLSYSQTISGGLVSLLSWDFQCESVLVGQTQTSESMVASVILANMSLASPDDIARTCAQNPSRTSACLAFMNQTVDFVATYMPTQENALSVEIERATAAIRSLQVELLQFGQLNPLSPLQLFRLNLLDPSEVGCAFFAWHFIVEWALGRRAVVALQGDADSLVVLTVALNQAQLTVTVAETPTVLAFYLRHTILYITVTMLGLASLVATYIGLSRGHIEAWNAFELLRVGAIVWCGRPLLFVRSLTAVALLSTSALHVAFSGHVSYFEVTDEPWCTTLGGAPLDDRKIQWQNVTLAIGDRLI